jgi:hypothetical protein
VRDGPDIATMTRETGGRRPRSAPSRRPRSAASRDPYGIGPVAGYVGPLVAVAGLVVVALVTLSLLRGEVPFVPTGAKPGASGAPGGVVATPAPSGVVVTPPETAFDGSILYAKAGNIWVQHDTTARQITNTGQDSMPAWSPDGKWIYFIRVQEGVGKFPQEGNFGRARIWYDLHTPTLMRMRADGTNVSRLLSGRYKQGANEWFFWLRSPAPNPDGKSITVITDGPNPLQSDIVVKTYTIATKQLVSLDLPENLSLGHQDPAWRPDGRFLLYVRNGRDGPRGAPQIYRYEPATKRNRALTTPGYLAPAYSPDGRFIAATRTGAFGTDVAILDANGAELIRVTDDGHSFSPVWSPAGDAIAYLSLTGTSVDLKLVKLDRSGGPWTVTDRKDLTTLSGLDGASRPSWFIPPEDLPAGSPSPVSSGSAAPSGSVTP